MDSFSDEFNRQPFPRWHDSLEATDPREMAPLRPRERPFAADTSEIWAEFEHTPTVGIATDALNSAIVANDAELAKRSAEVVVAHRDELPAAIVDMATKVLGGVSNASIVATPSAVYGSRIHVLRRQLSVYPGSAALHLDLARNLTILGAQKKAERSILAALTLNRENRTVLRNAARFFVTNQASDHALAIVRGAQATRHDPWLVATEIALSQHLGKSPKFTTLAQNFLKTNAFAPVHLSELATATATLSMMDGDTKLSKKLFQQGVIAPTENALAQVKWAERRFGLSVPGAEARMNEVPRPYEAAFYRAYAEQDMVAALAYAKHWYEIEPFSSVASTAVTYLGALVDDYETIIHYANLGLISHPDNVCLKNNMIFAQIASGKLLEGDMATVRRQVENTLRYLSAVMTSGSEDALHASANYGLLAFRLGAVDKGADIYENTIATALKAGYPQQATTAAVNFAREAVIAKLPNSAEILSRASQLVKRHANSLPSMDFYMKKVESAAKNPEIIPKVLSPEGSVDFIPNRKVEVKILGKKPDGRLIVSAPLSRVKSLPLLGNIDN